MGQTGRKRPPRPAKHKRDLGAQLEDPNSYGVRVSLQTYT
jgi:hypothetical protein